MMNNAALYKKLPSVDRLLSSDQTAKLTARYGATLVTQTFRVLLDEAREMIKDRHELPHEGNLSAMIENAAERLRTQTQVSMRPVFNLTGVVLHTNLGRAIFAEEAINAATTAMRHPVTLEYDLQKSARGHRDHGVSELMRQLTGADAACVVNNNAAAVLLMFAALADQKEAIVSRGELIEIGGSFRVPDVMRQAGATLVEVGTTNRTTLSDYQKAINPQTGLMVKVHPSNYKIEGFTASVSEAELSLLAREKNIPLAVDLGSGSLIDLSQYGLPHETTPQELLNSGVDLVSFSGDKLLGAPQAGIVIGRADLIKKLETHPLKRALRCDKVTLAALEATLRLYLSPEKLTETLPTLYYLSRDVSAIRAVAESLYLPCRQHYGEYYLIEVAPCRSQIGSGALPTDTIESFALTFIARDTKTASLNRLNEFFHRLPDPIIGRIKDNTLWLDLRCVDDVEALLRALTAQAFVP